MGKNIYALINPIDGKVVYVGQTTTSIEKRLNEHYWKLNEVKKGKRNWTPLFHFLDELLPLKVKIILLKQIRTDGMFDEGDFLEKFYIEKYRKENPNLLNVTNGGIGGNVYKYKTKEELKEIGNKISSKIKGKKKPEGFGEHLREIRSGYNSKLKKKLNPKIGAFKNGVLVKTFEYGFEINNFIGSKHAYGNILKSLNKGIGIAPYGYSWIYLKVKDIVRLILKDIRLCKVLLIQMFLLI